MKHLKQRVLALLLVMALLTLPAAASGASPESVQRADKLASLHLFRGTNTGYDLDSAPTRMQGLVMLIRLLGQEAEAKTATGATPFTDLPAWGAPYAAYAYANGLTKGTSSTRFSPDDPLRVRDYVTFLLRALGYSDSAKEFTWNNCLQFAASISMVSADSVEALGSIAMDRGDMVDLSFAALTCSMKGGEQTLAEKLQAAGVFTKEEGKAAGVLGGEPWVYTYTAYDNSTVSHTQQSVATSKGNVNVHVLTVNTKSPNVTVKAAMVDNTLGATAPFSQIVQSSGAFAAVNGNFFASYEAFKLPIGHVMVDGEFLFGNTGISALGITADGDLRVGRPSLFTRLKASNGAEWSAYSINSPHQSADVSILYTAAYGRPVDITAAGYVMEVVNGTISAYRAVSAGESVSVPVNGYFVYMGSGFASTDWFSTPAVGAAVTMEYYLPQADAEGFTYDGLVSIVSGAPRLVQDGAIVTDLEPGFTEERFTTAISARTAVGIHSSGKLLLVSASSASIQQMREVMLSLGCVDAINLDGGASCGMYYDGEYIATPGRELTTTLQIFVKK